MLVKFTKLETYAVILVALFSCGFLIRIFSCGRIVIHL